MPDALPPRRLADLRSATWAALTWSPDGSSELRDRCRSLFEVHHSILNGGFEGPLTNPSGNELPGAIDGADAIGAADAADVLRRAVELIGGTYPTDLDERTALLDHLDDATWDALDQLDDRWPADAVEVALGRAVQEHPDAFWTTPADQAHEAELLLLYLSELVGEAAAGDPVAAAAIDELAAWVGDAGTDDQRRRVDDERRRLRSLQR